VNAPLCVKIMIRTLLCGCLCCCVCSHLQGATDAHEFFVLESGSCDVYVTRPGDITAKKVKSYGPGSAFGELALLYAAPRAATVRGWGHVRRRRGLWPGLQDRCICRGDLYLVQHMHCVWHVAVEHRCRQTPATLLTCLGTAHNLLRASQADPAL